MNLQSKSPLIRKSALNRGNWKPNEELRVRFEEHVKFTEYEKEEDDEDEKWLDEHEREKQIIQNLFENGDSNQNDTENQSRGWKVLSTVTQATFRFASFARNALSSDEYYDMDNSTAGTSGGQGSPRSHQPQLVVKEIVETEEYTENESIFTRKNTLEDDKHSHGRIYTRPVLNGNGNVYFSLESA